jgi:hypothetical protein
MSYYFKYLKYKNKYIQLTGGVPNLDIHTLFILISNDYVGRSLLPGTSVDRKNFVEKLKSPDSPLYEDKHELVKIYPVDRNDKCRAVLITNTNKVQLLESINNVMTKYTACKNIFLIVSGHGKNARNFIDFQTFDFQTHETDLINLGDIINTLNKESLKNMYVFIDACRSGTCSRETGPAIMLDNKNLAIITEARRLQTSSDDVLTGGHLVNITIEHIRLFFIDKTSELHDDLTRQFIDQFEHGFTINLILMLTIMEKMLTEELEKNELIYGLWKYVTFAKNKTDVAKKIINIICGNMGQIYLNTTFRMNILQRIRVFNISSNPLLHQVSTQKIESWTKYCLFDESQYRLEEHISPKDQATKLSLLPTRDDIILSPNKKAIEIYLLEYRIKRIMKELGELREQNTLLTTYLHTCTEIYATELDLNKILETDIFNMEQKSILYQGYTTDQGIQMYRINEQLLKKKKDHLGAKRKINTIEKIQCLEKNQIKQVEIQQQIHKLETELELRRLELGSLRK